MIEPLRFCLNDQLLWALPSLLQTHGYNRNLIVSVWASFLNLESC